LVVPIQRAYGWRASFLAFGVIGVLWAVIGYRWYRDHPDEKEGVSKQEMEELSWIGSSRRRNCVRRVVTC
jgi:hypothetical protein